MDAKKERKPIPAFRIDSGEKLYGWVETMAEAEELACKYAHQDNCHVAIRTPIGRRLIEFTPGDNPRRLDFGAKQCPYCRTFVPYDSFIGCYRCKCGAHCTVREDWVQGRSSKKKIGGRTSRAGAFSDNSIIKLLVDKNPKRFGSKSYDRFNMYKDGMKVKDFLKAGGMREDLRWDSDRGFIEIK